MRIRTLIKNILLKTNPAYRVADHNRTQLADIQNSLIEMNDANRTYLKNILYEETNNIRTKLDNIQKILSPPVSDTLTSNVTENIGRDWISNSYYDGYGSEEFLHVFWDDNTIFYKHFHELDCTNIVELACGHGRHVQKYLDKSKTITLVDINQENIDL
jgi:hypothetical protein